MEEILLADLTRLHNGLADVEEADWIDAVAQVLAALPSDRASIWLLFLSKHLDRPAYDRPWCRYEKLVCRVTYWLNKTSR